MQRPAPVRIGSAAVALVAVLALFAAPSSESATASTPTWGPRDAWYRPYAAASIWNTPIGSAAQYVPSGYPEMPTNAVDPVYLIRSAATDPVRQVRAPYRWRDRCNTASGPTGVSVPMPDHIVIPDARPLPSGTWSTPNNQGVILDPDGRTLWAFSTMCRDTPGGPLYANHSGQGAVTDLFGDGRLGAHGASRMSSLGGAIRPGELTSGRPIAHVLDLVLHTTHAAVGPGGCFRWPANGCDSYGETAIPGNGGRYGGTVPEMQVGSLLALPPDMAYDDVGVATEVGRRLFDAMQDFGGYWTDDAAWDANYLVVDASATADIDAFGDPATRAEFGRIIAAAQVVANNSPTSVGGGGTPRAPLHVDEFTGGAITNRHARRLTPVDLAGR